MFRKFLLLALLPLLASTAFSQIVGPYRCDTIGTHASAILEQQDQFTCAPIPCIFPWTGVGGGQLCAGGTAFDNIRCGAWTSADGNTLGLIDLTICGPLCPELPVVPPPPVGWGIAPPVLAGTPQCQITGLAHTDSGPIPIAVANPSWLWASWVQPGLLSHWISRINLVVPAPGACFMAPQHCQWTAILPGQCITGLAEDSAGRNLFVGVTSFLTPAPAPLNTIYVTNLDNNFCTPTCQFTVPPCILPSGVAVALGPLTGLAYDSCGQKLCVSDANWIFCGKVNFFAGGCNYVVGSCCPNPTPGDPWVGLDKMPQPINYSCSACATPSCGSCVPVIKNRGYPALGNTQFGIDLTNLPNNYSVGIIAISPGPCMPAGINLGFCAPICLNFSIPGWPLNFFMPPGPGGFGCGASYFLPLNPLPLNPAVCGITVSTQAMVACPGLPFAGSAVTQCMDMRISGN